MAIEIGRVLRRRREWARLTQQELVDHTGMDRSASYISALETGRSSPTLVELEQLARYFRTTVVDLLTEAGDERAPEGRTGDDRLERVLARLGEADRELALDLLEVLARRR